MRDFPKVLRIEPAGACNLSCRHCPTGTVSIKRGIMRWETFLALAEQLGNDFSEFRAIVLYHGGEPFLNKRFVDMLRYIKERGGKFVKTVTNGMIFSKDLAQDLIDLGLDQIEFSIDSVSAEDNDFIRTNCDFNQVRQNIETLIKTKAECDSKTPKLCLSTVQFPTREQISSQAAPSASPFIEDVVQSLDSEIELKAFFAMEWPDINIDSSLFEVVTDSSDSYSTECDYVENTITVRWNGDVVPCCYDLTTKLKMGNILENSIEEIWKSEPYSSLYHQIITGEYNPVCENCNIVRPNRYLVRK